MKKWHWTAISLLLIAGCVSAPNDHVEIAPIEVNTLFEEWKNRQGMDQNTARASLEKLYGLTTENQVFEKLPPLSEDFNTGRKILYTGNTPALAEIPYSTYARPEFYPHFDQWHETWINHPPEKTYSLGVMVTPAEQYAILARDTTEFETTLFVGAAWDVTEYQGITLRATISPPAPIEVKIEPSDLLLGPTFPTFDPEWVQKVTVRGQITGKVEPGVYTITILRGMPSAEALADWETHDINISAGDSIFNDPEGLATLTLVRERGD